MDKQTSESNGHPDVEVVPIESLVSDVANVRRRDDRARRTLDASLAQFGPARSIVIDGNDVVRAGNGTLEAAQHAGVTEVLVVKRHPNQLVAVKVEDWSPTEATAYSIADNRTVDLGAFDEPGLAEVLRSLQSEQFDLSSVGFDLSEVDQLCERLAREFAGPLVFPKSDSDIDNDNDVASDQNSQDGDEPNYSQVRMVQLFFDGPTHEEFQDIVTKLQTEYKTTTTTDTVLECLRLASRSNEPTE